MKRLFTLLLPSIALLVSGPAWAQGGAVPIPPPGVVFQAPSGWQAAAPDSPVRIAQWSLPSSSGAGNAALLFFGPGQGGGAKASLTRWASLMTTPQGTPAPGRAAIRKGGVDDTIAITEFEVYGTYGGGTSDEGIPVAAKPDYGLVGAVLDYPGGPLYAVLTGPSALVKARRAAFERLLDSVRVTVPTGLTAPKAPADAAKKG